MPMFTPDMLGVLGAIGTVVFALTGAISAAKKRFDTFGMILLACVVGLGGGTLRDLLLGRLPVSWVQDPTEVLISTTVAVVAFLFIKKINVLKKSFYGLMPLAWLLSLSLAHRSHYRKTSHHFLHPSSECSQPVLGD